VINIKDAANTARKCALSFILAGLCAELCIQAGILAGAAYIGIVDALFESTGSRFPKISEGNLAENTSAAM